MMILVIVILRVHQCLSVVGLISVLEMGFGIDVFEASMQIEAFFNDISPSRMENT